MNDKYMTLFKKNNEQLNKELHKRGFKEGVKSGEHSNVNGRIFGGYFTPDRAIAEIIYKDAFDAGRSLKAKEVEEENLKHYMIEDNGYDRKFKVYLTSAQIRLLEWLDDFGLLHNDVEVYEPNTAPVKDVGRI